MFYSVFNVQFLTTCVVLVGSSGLEPPTSRLSGACSSLLSYEPVSCLPLLLGLCPSFSEASFRGGDEEIRTLDPLLAGQVLSQLSYTPVAFASGSYLLDPENRTTIDFFAFYSYTSSFSRALCEMDASFVSTSLCHTRHPALYDLSP